MSDLGLVARLDVIEDCNDMQVFPVQSEVEGRYVKITFASSSDFYGRVTVYRMEVRGKAVEELIYDAAGDSCLDGAKDSAALPNHTVVT